ncbi:MAG: iron-siderophore ABC transporter substrate-binding protein [Synechococcaceae cyanobacterium SM2_3_1]|nr:iron-siderophore ABC transporter substrate-binding protein [Synechococcaceae cyanobacterium SM2_3_1]
MRINQTVGYRGIKRFFPITLWAILSFALVVACSNNSFKSNSANDAALVGSAASSNVRMVTHLMGETQVPAQPQRVVTLDTSHLANALALGVQPIASTIWYDTREKTGLEPVEPYLHDRTQDLVILGHGFTADQVNLEKVLSLQPDLIMGSQDYKPIYEQLSRMAPTVLYAYANEKDGWKTFVRSSADALGKQQEAEQLLENYNQRVQDLQRQLGARLSTQVSVIHPLREGIRLMYLNFFGGQILQDVGLKRPPEQNKAGPNSQPVSFEWIPEMGGDIIFVISFMDQESLGLVEQLKNHPLWSLLDAVKQNKIYLVDASHWYGDDIIRANLILDDLFKYLVDERDP